MDQKIITCSNKACWGFFVDNEEERRKATENGWQLSNKTLCLKHRYYGLMQ